MVDSQSRHSFIIRLWLEPRELSNPPEWRWHVHHVQGGEESYFTELTNVLNFVSSISGTPVSLSSGGEAARGDRGS